MTAPLLKKQIRYASFFDRSLASFIDMILIMIIITPVAVIDAAILYGNKPPASVLRPLTEEIIKQQDAHAVKFTSMIGSIFHDPRIQQYFMTNGYKFAIDQMVQIAAIAIIITWCWGKWATTPGKAILSMRVVDSETFEKLTLKQRIIRFSSYVLSIAPLFLGILWIIFDKRKQGWHDKLAGSIVIKR